MGQHDKHLIGYARGKGSNLGKAENMRSSWQQFIRLHSNPTRTGETRKQYDKLSVEEKLDKKSVDGWISPAQCKDNKRKLVNILPRDLIALDIDHADEHILTMIEMGLTPLSDYEFYAHVTRSHLTGSPRVRLWLPLDGTASREEAGPLTRLIAWDFDGRGATIKQVDVVSVRPAQMMFLPTLCKDGEWWSYRNEGKLLNPQQRLEEHGDWRNLALLPRFEGENELRISAEKAENPLEKKEIGRAHV